MNVGDIIDELEKVDPKAELINVWTDKKTEDGVDGDSSKIKTNYNTSLTFKSGESTTTKVKLFHQVIKDKNPYEEKEEKRSFLDNFKMGSRSTNEIN